ncbi:MAG: transcriptional regulator, partial [Chitinophagaceae bacterium]
MKTIALFCFFLFWMIFSPEILIAQQTIGQSSILNFYHEDINAGAQNWAIKQDKLGNIYFANNTGLLVYNGKEWKMYRLPNKTIVRALDIASDMKIYVGGQDALGYFYPDERGVLIYQSLIEKLPISERKFGDVWNIEILNNDIYFRTGSTILRYNRSKNNFYIYKSPVVAGWSFMGICNGKLYAQAGTEGLLVLKNNSWGSFEKDAFLGKTITAIQKIHQDDLLVFTLQDGVYLVSNSKVSVFPIDKRIVESRITTTHEIGDGLLAIGTIANGVFIIDASGKLVKNFSSDNDLQNNYVLSLFADKNNILWMGLDEGISLVDYFSPIQKITGFSKTPIPSYTSVIYKNQLFVGTSDGVFASPLSTQVGEDISSSKASFYRVKNTSRQVWNLSSINDQLFMGLHNGTFLMNDVNQMHQYSNVGTWLFRPLPRSQNIISGTYEGIQLIKKEDGKIKVDRLIDNNILEPFRFIEIDSARRIVWASHPYRGVYKIQLNKALNKIENSELLNSKNGLPSNLNNFVFKVNGRIVFTTENGVYEFDFNKKLFVESVKFKPVFGKLLIKFLVNDSQGRIWFATERKCGVVEQDKIKYIPELDGKLIAGFENINPFSSKNILFSTYKGIIHLNYELYQKRFFKIQTLISKVQAIGTTDTLLFNGYFIDKNKNIVEQQDKFTTVRLPANFNSFHFEFSSDRYGVDDKILYSYQLMGYDQEWSLWSNVNYKDYTNLSYGKYSFSIKSKDNFGNESAVLSYSFEILPKWYQTKFAYSVYFLLAVVVFYTALHLHRKRLEKQKTEFLEKQSHLKYVHELELEHNEKEIVKLKNNHLESEMQFKNKELANTTMHLYKRGRLLGKIKEDLENAIKKVSIKEEKTEFTKLLKLIATEEKDENSWEQFAIHFDEVHNRFLEKLKS